MKRTLAVLGMTILICVVLPGSANSQQAIVLKGGKLLTVSHGTIENGVLVIENGKITAVGSAAEVKIPANARVQDVSGMTVYPGLIDSESYLGLTEISAEQMTNDLIELSDEIMPHMHVYDAFHAESELIPVARLNGITNAIVAPGNKDTPPGQDSLLQLSGKSSQEPSDLAAAVSLAREFNLKFVLNHISHSQPVLDYVASLKVPVIVGPIYEAPKPQERYDAVYSLPAQLYERGVKIAFASYDAHNVRNLPYAAGYATAFGLPRDEALKAVTLNAAEIWGVDGNLGSLDAGKTANVVVANGDPLDIRTDVKQVFIHGREIR